MGTRAETSSLGRRKVQPDWVSHVMDVVQPHCSPEAVVGLKRKRMGMRHHTHADTPGSCSKAGGQLYDFKEIGNMWTMVLWWGRGQDKNLQRADSSFIFFLAFICKLMKIVWLPKRKSVMVVGFLFFFSKVPQLHCASLQRQQSLPLQVWS